MTVGTLILELKSLLDKGAITPNYPVITLNSQLFNDDIKSINVANTGYRVPVIVLEVE